MNRKLFITVIFMLVALNGLILKGLNADFQRDKAVQVGDALEGIIGDPNALKETNTALVKEAREKKNNGSITSERPNSVSVLDALKGVVGDSNTPDDSNEVIEISLTEGARQSEELLNAEEDDPKAVYELGIQYLRGSGDITRDVPKALELLEKSAELGNCDAMLELAYIYQKGNDIDRDFRKSREWLRKAAEAGKGIAMLALGERVYEEQDPNISEEERVQWVEKGLKRLGEAAEKGDCDGMRTLGMVYQPIKAMNLGSVVDSVSWLNMHLLGSQLPGIDTDERKSAEWYQKALAGYQKKAETGDSEAMYWLGKMYELGLGTEKDAMKKLQWYRKAAEAGHSEGMVEFGWACHNAEDFKNAFIWFNKAAEQGNTEAMVSLGWLSSKGQGVSKDKLEAIKWWRRAAERGHPKAMLFLGAAYANGEGVNRDYQQTVTWYKKGADGGDVTCMFGLGLMYSTGRGVASDPNAAIEWWTKGAEKEHTGCMANLGWIYLYGKGVQENREQARIWLRKAADLGNEYARNRLHELGEIR